MSKVAIIGNGTAGALAYATMHNFAKENNLEIDWYYDSNIKAKSVGEGTTPTFLGFLNKHLDVTNEELNIFDARIKHGISYENWARQNFMHPFVLGKFGVHMDASKFQRLMFDKAQQNKINIIDKHITHSDIDAELIVDATGYPLDFSEYDKSKYIPVNSVHVVQCNWDGPPRWDHTKTMARPWGWVFVIPLQSRCSVGYLYNNKITNISRIEEDILNVLYELSLTPNGNKNSFSFKNYVKKDLFKNRVVWVGNSGFFLEPMEATTLDCVINCLDEAVKITKGVSTPDYSNEWMHKLFEEIECFIMMHYSAGSKWKNEFWDFAQERGKKCLEESPDRIKHFWKNQGKEAQYFPDISYNLNINGLGLQHIRG